MDVEIFASHELMHKDPSQGLRGSLVFCPQCGIWIQREQFLAHPRRCLKRLWTGTMIGPDAYGRPLNLPQAPDPVQITFGGLKGGLGK